MLSTRGITRSFGEVRALRGVDLTFEAGEIHAVLGENGAGKSTLVAICTGALAPDAGVLVLHGTPTRFDSPIEAVLAGIAVVHQEPALISEMTVLDNLYLTELATSPWFKPYSRDKLRKNAEQLLRRLDISLDLDLPVRRLSVAARQLVEIAKALRAQPRILFLDEPNSALTATESTQLFETISRLRDDGTAVVLISHRLAEVMTLADRVTVLRDGSVVWTGPTREISPSKAIGLMVGRSEAALQELRPTTSPGEVRLSCLGLTRRGEFDDIDFEVRAGEVHGMAGLVGAGRSELAACLFGASRPDAGSIDIDGHDVSFRAPIDAIRAGIALVPEDRRLQGIFPGLSVLRNGAAATDALGRDDTGAVRDALRRLRVKAPSLDASIATLSGGNQQKVVLARWLALDPRILILDEPTRGVDVGTKLEIYELIGELVGRGTAVLLISSDIEELMALTTRITVMRRGRIVARLGSGASANDVVSAAFGHAE